MDNKISVDQKLFALIELLEEKGLITQKEVIKRAKSINLKYLEWESKYYG